MASRRLLLLPLLIFLTSCGPKLVSLENESLTADLTAGLGCVDARSKIFDHYYRAHSEGTDLSYETLEAGTQGQLQKNLKLSQSSSKIKARYQKSLQSIHKIMTEEISAFRIQTVRSKVQGSLDSTDVAENESDPLLHLARLEMRSGIEPRYEELNAKLDEALKEGAEVAQTAQLACENVDPIQEPPLHQPPLPEPVIEDPQLEEPQPQAQVPADSATGKNHPLYGALFTMATSYQSCQVLELPPVNKSVDETRGVRRGASIDGVGYGRVYSDVALLNKTHYYHRGQSYGPDCASQNQKPLVYDYGGRPVIKGSELDMFTNSGGGTALGIDCSAFVSTAAGVAGNRYNASTTNKPVYTRFVSRDFIDPKTSNWSCYDSVKVGKSQSIQAGDIAAVKGHVVMIDHVGADPFGLNKITSTSGCSRINFQNFDFTVVQSSPEKGSIGINRFEVKDYLTAGGKMANMFLGYAKQACLSKFDGTVRTPKTSDYGMIRHKQTRSCLAPRVTLKNESCVRRCPALTQ